MNITTQAHSPHLVGGGGSKEPAVDSRDRKVMSLVSAKWIKNSAGLPNLTAQIFAFVTGKIPESLAPAEITDRFFVTVSRVGSGINLETVEIPLNTSNSSFCITVRRELKKKGITPPPLHDLYFHENYTRLQDPNHATYPLKDLNVSKIPAGHTIDLISMVTPFSQEKIGIINSVTTTPYLLGSLTDAQKQDFDIVLAAVRRDGTALQFACPELKDDKDIVFAAVTNAGIALKFASNRLKNDMNISVAAIKNSHHSFSEVSPLLRIKKDFAVKAVEKNVSVLGCLIPEIRYDEDVVLAAVTQDGRLLYHSGELRSNQKIAIAAITQNAIAFMHASKELRNNRNFVLEALEANGLALRYVLEEFDKKYKNDKGVMLAAVRQNGLALRFAPKKFRGDRDVILAAVEENPDALQYASNQFKKKMVVFRPQ
jgi:hypothetical protein